jgi:hypothetical protein
MGNLHKAEVTVHGKDLKDPMPATITGPFGSKDHEPQRYVGRATVHPGGHEATIVFDGLVTDDTNKQSPLTRRSPVHWRITTFNGATGEVLLSEDIAQGTMKESRLLQAEPDSTIAVSIPGIPTGINFMAEHATAIADGMKLDFSTTMKDSVNVVVAALDDARKTQERGEKQLQSVSEQLPGTIKEVVINLANVSGHVVTMADRLKDIEKSHTLTHNALHALYEEVKALRSSQEDPTNSAKKKG